MQNNSENPKTRPAARPTLDELRLLLVNTEPLRAKEHFQAHALARPIQQGSLIEVSGTARSDWVAQTLALNPQFKIAWCEDLFTVHPPALAQRQVDLSRVIFLSVGRHLHWSALQILKSHLFQALVMPGDCSSRTQDRRTQDRRTDDRALKRLQLMAEKSSCSVFFISEKLSESWSIHVQIEAHRDRESEQITVTTKKFKAASE